MRFQAKITRLKICDFWGVFKIKKDLYHLIELFELSKKKYYIKVSTFLDQKLWPLLWSKNDQIWGISLIIFTVYANLYWNLTTKPVITFDLGELRLWCNTFFCSVWRALSGGKGLFWFRRPPPKKMTNFKPCHFCLKTQKIAKYSKTAGLQLW